MNWGCSSIRFASLMAELPLMVILLRAQRVPPVRCILAGWEGIVFSRSIAAVALFCLASSPLSAGVVRIEVQSRADVLGGKPFGDAGAYEKLTGKIYFEIDPSNTANTIITDIGNAPRNARGRAEFSSDFFLIKPKQIERGNGTVLYEVSNRGGKGMLGFFDQGTGSLNPTSEADLGDGFLLQRGFTLLWLGWQFDVAA